MSMTEEEIERHAYQSWRLVKLDTKAGKDKLEIEELKKELSKDKLEIDKLINDLRNEVKYLRDELSKIKSDGAKQW